MTRRGKVRIGFTTGSAVTAAAKAGLLFLLRGVRSARVDIPSPEGLVRLLIPVEYVEVDASPPDVENVPDVQGVQGARAAVRKQAGDDPDATNGAAMVARVHLEPWSENEVLVHGGEGVGVVTRPGLPVPVGQAAINPGPLKQIRRAVLEIMGRFNLRARVHVRVEVPDGNDLAARTLNPRLGIVGGISILGTRGTVKAFSHAAWKETIVQCLDVARAEGLDTVALTTGGRGQRFLEDALPWLPRLAFIQAGDHPGFAMRQAAGRGMRRVVWGGFWGKLVKMAQGRPQTHARLFAVDLPCLAAWAAEADVRPEATRQIARANTAREALEILRKTNQFNRVTGIVIAKALEHSRIWVKKQADVKLILLDYDGQVLQNVASPDTPRPLQVRLCPNT